MINYYLMTKPGIVMGNLVTFAAGFLLASRGVFHIGLFAITLFGLGFIMASACVFNNYIDRHLDEKMNRTKNRALVKKIISGRHAILFATILGCIGFAILGLGTNLLTFSVAAAGFLVYVVLYSLWKSQTIFGTAIGSIAGAVPPVVGYCAVSNDFDIGALILFAMLVFWQMPHFFAIALSNYEDYKAADIPVLPIKKGALIAKIHMVLYIIAFIISASLLTYFEYTGHLYLSVAVGFGILWLILAIRGFTCKDDQLWGHKMFQFSLVLIGAISIIIPFDV